MPKIENNIQYYIENGKVLVVTGFVYFCNKKKSIWLFSKRKNWLFRIRICPVEKQVA